MENFGIHLEPLRAILYQVGAFIPRHQFQHRPDHGADRLRTAERFGLLGDPGVQRGELGGLKADLNPHALARWDRASPRL